MKKLFKDPLLHFLLIGAALFICFDVFDDSSAANENTIVITRGDIEAMRANFSRTWQRQPTVKEMEGLMEERVRGEIAYREALAMGLDKNDAYIRQRLRMKMELLVEDIGTLAPPAEKDLSAFLEKNRETFKLEPQAAFSHVYFSAEKHGITLEEDIQMVLKKLREEGASKHLEEYGDSIMLPREYPLSPLNVIQRQFGERFTEELVKLEPGTWQGPVRSGYGLHLVHVEMYVEGRDPDLAEVRPAVERELMAKRRKDIKEETYNKLRQRYQVKVEQEAGEGA